MDIAIRRQGRAGRITLTRPEALNALTEDMVRAIDAALIEWASEPAVALVLIDAEGPRAFSAGGDIVDLYHAARAGEFRSGQMFWRHEYRMNARIARYPKPVVSFLQGYCMGGGVGLGCHGSHRIVGESSRIAMPECMIGLMPDVGGTMRLARAPGRLGAWLGTTAVQMGPGDAIHAGFADRFIPEALWPELIAQLAASGDVTALPDHAAPKALLPALAPEIDRVFAGHGLETILEALGRAETGFATETLDALHRVSPLAAACTLETLRRLGPSPTIEAALELEYRFSFRAQQHSDLIEGIRAAVIEKDRRPKWRHTLHDVPHAEVMAMLAPLGDDRWTMEDQE